MKALYNLFSGKSPITIILIIFFAVLLWIPSLLPGNEAILPYPAEPMPLFGFLAGLFESNHTGSILIAFALFLFTGFLLDYLNVRYILVQERTFLPVWFFIVITSFYPGIYQLTPLLPATMMIALMLHFISASYKAEANCYRFFEAGLILGVAGLFYAPAIWFILFIWISAIILRPFYWREWLFPLLGIFAIFFLAWGYYYVVYGDATRFFVLLSFNLTPVFVSSLPDIKVIAGTAYVFLMIIFSSFFMLKAFQFKKVYARNYFNVLFWLFLLSLLFFFFPSGGNYGVVYLFSFPVAYIITNYFVNK